MLFSQKANAEMEEWDNTALKCLAQAATFLQQHLLLEEQDREARFPSPPEPSFPSSQPPAVKALVGRAPYPCWYCPLRLRVP